MIDLHLHLDGSLNPAQIMKMAQMSEVELEHPERLEEQLRVEPDCTSLGEYLEKFELPLRLLQTRASISYAVYDLMRSLHQQGLCYAEIRFAPALHQQRGLTQEEVVQAAVDGLEKGKQEFALPANLILCCMRGDANVSENEGTIAAAEKYLGKGVCAVDLAGNEAAYPTSAFSALFAAAKEKQIPVIIHAGEAAGADSVWQALDLGAARIGHGIHSAEDEALVQHLGERGICLEMCYTSNLQTKAVERSEDYPLRGFLDHGLKVTLNTDNMTVSNTMLKREYTLVQEQFGLKDEELLQIALNAADAAFVSETEREELKNRIRKEFFSWLR